MASITAPDGLHFGDTFEVEFVPPKSYKGGLWARADCYREGDGHLYTQFVNLDDTSSQDGPFVLGPTPSWLEGGASCTVQLMSLSGIHPDRVFASDDFTVEP